MPLKWKVLKDGSGNALEAGFIDLVAGAGQTVEEFDEPQAALIAEIKARVTDSPKLIALSALDASAEAGTLKTMLEYLQSIVE